MQGDSLDNWSLLAAKPDWAAGLRANWTPGEAGAHLRLTEFLSNPVQDYTTARDVPAQSGTSRLSPHVHFGEISPRLVWHLSLIHISPKPRPPKSPLKKPDK